MGRGGGLQVVDTYSSTQREACASNGRVIGKYDDSSGVCLIFFGSAISDEVMKCDSNLCTTHR